MTKNTNKNPVPDSIKKLARELVGWARIYPDTEIEVKINGKTILEVNSEKIWPRVWEEIIKKQREIEERDTKKWAESDSGLAVKHFIISEDFIKEYTERGVKRLIKMLMDIRAVNQLKRENNNG